MEDPRLAIVRSHAGLSAHAERDKEFALGEVTRVALHEAGHAVIGHKLGQDVELIHFQPELGGYSCIAAEVRWVEKSRTFNRRQAAINYRTKLAITQLAGPAAESAFLGKIRLDTMGADAQRAFGHCRAMTNSDTEAEALYSELYRRALEYVEADNETIRAVADALIRGRRLDAETFKRIISAELVEVR